MSEVHLDGFHVIEWREGKWQPRGSLSRKDALRLTRKALEHSEARSARLRMVLEEWDIDLGADRLHYGGEG